MAESRIARGIDFLSVSEVINDAGFNPVEFEGIRNRGSEQFRNYHELWIDKTSAIGLVVSPGRYGGTLADKDTAFEFASWIPVECTLDLIRVWKRSGGNEG